MRHKISYWIFHPLHFWICSSQPYDVVDPCYPMFCCTVFVTTLKSVVLVRTVRWPLVERMHAAPCQMTRSLKSPEAKLTTCSQSKNDKNATIYASFLEGTSRDDYSFGILSAPRVRKGLWQSQLSQNLPVTGQTGYAGHSSEHLKCQKNIGKVVGFWVWTDEGQKKFGQLKIQWFGFFSFRNLTLWTRSKSEIFSERPSKFHGRCQMGGPSMTWKDVLWVYRSVVWWLQQPVGLSFARPDFLGWWVSRVQRSSRLWQTIDGSVVGRGLVEWSGWQRLAQHLMISFQKDLERKTITFDLWH